MDTPAFFGSRRGGHNGAVHYNSDQYAQVNRFDPHHLRALRQAFPNLLGTRVLEVGCGRGFLLDAMQRAGAEAVGIDANPHAVRHGVADGMAVGDAQELAFPEDSFDAVVSVHAIEHVPDLDRALQEMTRVLRPGGRLLLVYPAEPVRGLWAVPTALILHGNPLRAREVHCQKVTPRRLERRVLDLPLTHAWSAFSWRGWPQYTTVFDKAAAGDDRRGIDGHAHREPPRQVRGEPPVGRGVRDRGLAVR